MNDSGLRCGAKMVATPGRLVDLLAERRVDLASVCFLVVDEADKVYSSSFYLPPHPLNFVLCFNS